MRSLACAVLIFVVAYGAATFKPHVDRYFASDECGVSVEPGHYALIRGKNGANDRLIWVSDQQQDR